VVRLSRTTQLLRRREKKRKNFSFLFKFFFFFFVLCKEKKKERKTKTRKRKILQKKYVFVNRQERLKKLYWCWNINQLPVRAKPLKVVKYLPK
jgi:hypothetical protein